MENKKSEYSFVLPEDFDFENADPAFQGDVRISDEAVRRCPDEEPAISLSRKDKMKIASEVLQTMSGSQISDLLTKGTSIDGISRLRYYSEFIPKEISWLMYPYIPFGKLTVVSGDPGTGKSKLILTLLARITRGLPLPFSNTSQKPESVIYLSTEDEIEDSILPYFLAAGGDPEKIVTIDESIDPIENFSDPRIKDAVRRTGARVLVFDPIASYIGANVNMNLANQTRSQMNHLINLAKEENIAVILVAHLNKNSGQKAIYRNSGSIDFVGSVRSAMTLSNYKTGGKNQRVLYHTKSNAAEKGLSIIFEFQKDGTIEFLRTEDIDPDGGCEDFETNDREERKEAARELIVSLLEENDGEVSAREIFKKTDGLNMSKTAIKMLKKDLEIISKKTSDGWVWCFENPGDQRVKDSKGQGSEA